MVVAVRTPPHGSWKGPAERIMSILNMRLQTVGLMRSESPYRDIENEIKKKVRQHEGELEEKDSDVRREVIRSVDGVKHSDFSKV